jgi:hypothetical protein
MKTSLVLLFSLITSFAFAQKDFKRGFYITNQGDTVRTYINDKDWNQNPREISVSNNEEGKGISTLKLSRIREFTIISGDTYVREVVTIDTSPNRISKMVADKEPEFTSDTVFLQLLVRGTQSLYYLKDENLKEHFFLQNKLNKPQELILRKLKKQINGKYVVQVQELYKNTLSSSFSDCPEVAKMVYGVKYSKNSMIDIFYKYNACSSGYKDTYVAEKEKVELKICAIAGISQVNVDFNNFKSITGINETEFKNTSYIGGGSIEILIPRNRRKWSVYNEVVIKPYKLEGHYENQETHYYLEKVDFRFDYNYIGLGTMVRYHILPGKKVHSFLNAGIANNFMLKGHNVMMSETTYFNKTSTETKEVFDDSKSYEFALLIGGGIKYNRLGGEFRYEVGDGMTRTATVTKHMVSFILSYSIN